MGVGAELEPVLLQATVRPVTQSKQSPDTIVFKHYHFAWGVLA
jgi:hypothetical protein